MESLTERLSRTSRKSWRIAMVAWGAAFISGLAASYVSGTARSVLLAIALVLGVVGLPFYIHFLASHLGAVFTHGHRPAGDKPPPRRPD